MKSQEFKAWPKIPRGTDFTVTITEKYDGTNACVLVNDGVVIGAQSRTRIITPENDNYGFAAWVEANKDELAKLGDGYHYGEWYGEGIQKNPHQKVGKHFALFNTFRDAALLPKCVEVVRLLHVGRYSPEKVEACLEELKTHAELCGYVAEGLVVYFHSTRTYEKHTFKNSRGKWLR